MVKESKSLNIISTEGGFLTFYPDLAFPRICGRRIPLSRRFTVIYSSELALGKYDSYFPVNSKDANVPHNDLVVFSGATNLMFS